MTERSIDIIFNVACIIHYCTRPLTSSSEQNTENILVFFGKFNQVVYVKVKMEWLLNGHSALSLGSLEECWYLPYYCSEKDENGIVVNRACNFFLERSLVNS